MKKKGFTLAEVLVTLGIIGVVSAVTLPTLMIDSKYKQIGVKLAKFQSATENSARSWVLTNEEFKPNRVDLIDEFIDNTFLINRVLYSNGTVKDNNTYTSVSSDAVYPLSWEEAAAELKDGTRVAVSSTPLSSITEIAKGRYDESKYGESAFVILFDPQVKGLHEQEQKYHMFAVTSKGFVLPADRCTVAISDDNWVVKKSTYMSIDKCKIEKNEWIFDMPKKS